MLLHSFPFANHRLNLVHLIRTRSSSYSLPPVATRSRPPVKMTVMFTVRLRLCASMRLHEREREIPFVCAHYYTHTVHKTHCIAKLCCLSSSPTGGDKRVVVAGVLKLHGTHDTMLNHWYRRREWRKLCHCDHLCTSPSSAFRMPSVDLFPPLGAFVSVSDIFVLLPGSVGAVGSTSSPRVGSRFTQERKLD